MASGLEREIDALRELTIRASKIIEDQRIRLAESERREKELQYELDKLRRQLSEAQMDIKYLRVSHRLASSSDSIIESRRLISGLIRNIDKVIADLKE